MILVSDPMVCELYGSQQSCFIFIHVFQDYVEVKKWEKELKEADFSKVWAFCIS